MYISIIQSQNANGCVDGRVLTATVHKGTVRRCRAADGVTRIYLQFHALSLVLNQFFPSNPPRARTTLMADLLASYQGLSASSSRADVSKALNAIISGPWPIHDPSPPLTFPQHSPLTVQTARPSSLPFYQISSLAGLAERMAGFSIQVLSATLVFDH